MSEKTHALAVRNIFADLDSADFKGKLQRAIPETLRVDRVIQLAYTLLRNDEALASCSKLSILASIASASQLGLELDKTLGHAYLVKFGEECALIVGYRGFMHLMYQSGSIIEVSAEIVRQGDKFRHTLGTHRGLLHEPGPTPKNDNPEQWLGAYAVAKMLTNQTAFEYMDKEHVESCRNRSKSWQKFKKEGKSTIWQTDPEEMWRKTPIRRLAKRMPVSPTDKRAALLRAVILDEYGERRGLLIPKDTGWEVNPNPPEDTTNGEPLAETTEDLSGQLQESIEDVQRRQGQVAAKNKAVKAPKKNPASDRTAPGPPKAAIPPESKISDDYINVKQQTDVINQALAAGWTLDEFIGYVQKTYSVKTIREVRQSQYAKLVAKAKGDAR